MHELTGIISTYARPVQAQTRKYPNMEEGSWHEILPLAEELLTSVCY